MVSPKYFFNLISDWSKNIKALGKINQNFALNFISCLELLSNKVNPLSNVLQFDINPDYK